jgi:hypothetical protein
MELSTLMVVVVFMAICVLPFVIAYFKGKKKDAQMVKTLNDFAHEHQCNINEFELCGDFALGVDTQRSFLFFIKNKKMETISQFVDLTRMRSCEPIKQRRDVEMDHETMSIVERVELAFSPNGNSSVISLDLFDERVNDRLTGELQFVETWSKRISNYLKK